ncbi:hypothetical protein Tco_0004427 [Tanacetum coccineum]
MKAKKRSEKPLSPLLKGSDAPGGGRTTPKKEARSTHSFHQKDGSARIVLDERIIEYAHELVLQKLEHLFRPRAECTSVPFVHHMSIVSVLAPMETMLYLLHRYSPLPPEESGCSLPPEETCWSLPPEETSCSLPPEETGCSLHPEETLLLNTPYWLKSIQRIGSFLEQGPRSISSRIFNYYILDKAYESLLDTAYRTLFFVVSCEVQAQIRRIFLDGYGVLDVRTIFFGFLRLSSRLRAFLLIFTKRTDKETTPNPYNQGFLTSSETRAFIRDADKAYNISHHIHLENQEQPRMPIDELQRCTLATGKCLLFWYSLYYHERMKND